MQYTGCYVEHFQYKGHCKFDFNNFDRLEKNSLLNILGDNNKFIGIQHQPYFCVRSVVFFFAEKNIDTFTIFSCNIASTSAKSDALVIFLL